MAGHIHFTKAHMCVLHDDHRRCCAAGPNSQPAPPSGDDDEYLTTLYAAAGELTVEDVCAAGVCDGNEMFEVEVDVAS